MRADSFTRTRRRAMARTAVLLAAVLWCSATAAPRAALAAKKTWERFKFPELGQVHQPDYQRHVLENGLVVYLMPDHTWPMVEGQVLVRTGSAYEPPDKVGLAQIEAEVLRSGGTKSISGDELDEQLERMGAYIESGIDETEGTVSFSFLSKDAKRGLELVGDVLRNPAFDQEKIDVTKTAQRAAIARRNDEMQSVLQREVSKAVWGPDHPYARHAEYATIDAVKRNDLVTFYDYFYHPNRMMMAVWGDFDAPAMLQQVKAVLADWPKTDNPLPPLPKAPKGGSRRVLVANKEDVTQSWFAAGHVGMRADDPDYFAMRVMNRILGGGFGDRLFNEVRSKLGYAYAVGSTDGTALDHEGTFLAYCGTKSSTTDDALQAVLGEIEKMRSQPVSEKELENAKDAILNSHVFNFAQRSQVLIRLLSYEYYGYPSDFLDKYVEGIKKVDIPAVQDVAKRRIHPDEFAIVAVGKTAEWDNDLSQFGPVEKLDITIPEPKGEEFPPPTTETIERGRAILASAQTAMGGKALRDLKALRVSESVGLSIQGMSLSASTTQSIIFPDKMHASIKLPFGEMIQVLNGSSGWAKGPQGIQDVTGGDAEDLTNAVLTDPLYLLGHYDQFQVQALQGEKVGDVAADVVLARVGDKKWIKLYIDTQSKVLLKTSTMGKDLVTRSPGLEETFYSDVRAVGGLNVPHKSRTLHAGQEQMSREVTSFEVNPKIETSLFVRPQS
jgi:zinc protease